VGARWRGLLERALGRPGGGARGAPGGLRRALLCVLDGDLGGAEAELQRLARDDSSQVEVYLALARVFRLRGDLGRAIRVHQNLLLRPDAGAEARSLARRGLADDLRAAGFGEQARAAYEALLAERPRDAAALRALIALAREAGDPERALECAERLHRLTGESDEARSREAALQLEVAEKARGEGRADAARRAVKRALRRDRASAAAQIALGELEAERGRSKRALAAWRRALALDPRRGGELFGRLRSAFAALGRSGEYEPFLRARLREAPGDPEARLELARLLAERGEAAAAAAELRTLLEAAPDHLEAQAELGRALAAAGRLGDACAAWSALADRLGRIGALRPGERALP
jgi:lipopolysaccharide biosynthesis regulator YciM